MTTRVLLHVEWRVSGIVYPAESVVDMEDAPAATLISRGMAEASSDPVTVLVPDFVWD